MIFMQRSRLEIVNEILSLCLESRLTNRVIYGCNLSYDQMVKYKRFLERKGLLRVQSKEGKNLLQTTEKGSEFVKDFARISRFLQ